ncbi:MAG: PAS domain-containing sensor histidine kinase, partial [Janthinobacterium lividum]
MTLEYPSWPVGDGEMVGLIASYDWAATAIGPSDAWLQPLRTMVEVMLASPMLMSLAVGPERVFIYNDEAARYYGGRHPSVLGLGLPQAFAHEFSKVAAFYDRVFAGESLHIPAQPLDPDESGTTEVFDAYLVPVRDTTGHVIAAAMTGFAVGKRVYAEARLRQSEERLALAFKTLPVGIAIVDAIGDTVMANDEMQRFLPTGKIPSRDPARSGRWQGWDANGAIIQPQNFPGARALRGESVSPGMQMLYQDDAGVEAWTEVLSAPLPDGKGRTNGAITVVIDVDRLKRSEQAAQESDERLRQFGEASLDILWIRDAETLQWTYLTPAFEAIYGLSREEALDGDNYRDWQNLILPEDRARAVASTERVSAGERVTFEYRIRRPVDGQVRWLRNTDFPMHDAAGRVVRIGGVGHDITALKATQAAMADSELRLRTLTEGIPQLVWRSCDKGLWTWCSPQWMRFTGQSQEESHSLGWLDVVHPDDHAAAKQAWDDAQLHGMLNVEFRVRRASDDAWIWHSTRSVPVRGVPGTDGAEGPIMEWLGTTTDIHDLKRLQGEQQVLVAELQHRTRNLLAVVRNVARRSISPSPERDEYDARLGAIGRVQGFLSRSPGYSVPLGDLVQAELRAAGEGASDRVNIDGPVVDLPGESVQVVALALHELATNAVKYGAIGQTAARLSVTWRVEAGKDDGPCLIIDWRESGVTMPVGPPAHGGYGSELITRALPYQLRAETTLEFTHDGVRCGITLPASAFSGDL